MTTRRQNSTERRPPSRATRTRLLVVCGGKRTEPAYLDGLRRARRNPAVVVKVVTHERDPLGIVNYARKTRDRAKDNYDEVWCVLDVDDFQFDEVLAAAERDRINLAISNPCFEVWLLLHHVDLSAPLNGAAEALSRLKKALPGYDKTDLRFADFAELVREAVRRAQALSDGRTPILGPNPSSGIWPLVTLMVDEGERPLRHT